MAIIAILAAMVIGIAARISSQGKEQLTENTFALLDSALGEFQDYGYNYDAPYSEFDFPLDCNDFDKNDLENALEAAPGITNVSSVGGDGTHDPNYSGSEALYFFLSRVPESRKTLDKIDSSLITNKDKDKRDMTITVDGKEYPLLRIIDPWGTTLRYDYYDEDVLPPNPNEARIFPVITSAGPDKEFGTADDISSG